MKNLKFGDFIVLFLIILLALFAIFKVSVKKGNSIRISAADTEYFYPLSKNGIYEIQGSFGITKIQVENKKVRIIESCCPNKTCVKQGWGTTIVCLPNNVIVTVENDEGDIDAIAE